MYKSEITKNGNVGISYVSQEAANLQALEMDMNNCSRCSGCSGCSRCSGCSDCSDCSGCSDFKTNPSKIIVSDIGSRNDTIYVYWSCDRTEVICGCFRGSLLNFEEAVENTHKDNEHGQRYKELINQAWSTMSI